MSGTKDISVGPFGVAAPTRRPAPTPPPLRRRPPAASARAKTRNAAEFDATGPQAPLPQAGRPGPHDTVEPARHPAMPPVPDAGFEALVEFTRMLEDEVAAAERRALAHGREWKPPFSALTLRDTKV